MAGRAAAWFGWGVVAGVSLCAGSAAADDDAFPDEVRVTTVSRAEPYRRNYELPRRKTAAAEPTVVRVKLLRERVLFVDVDGNGRVDDVGLDGWTLEGDEYRYVVPFEDSLAVGDHRVWLRFSEDGNSVAFRAEKSAPPRGEPAKRVKEAAAALRVWNDLRLRNGLPPVWLDAELALGCVLHSRYMARHGLTHAEDPAKDLYTELGARAGKNGNVGTWAAREEIGGMYRSFYHRISLFHPATRGAGIGDVGGRCTFDGTTGREDRRWLWPVIVPAPSTVGVPLEFSAEEPVIHRDVFRGRRALNGAGFPISVTFPHDDVKGAAAELRVAGPAGKPVEFLLSSPEKPGNAEIPNNYRSIGLVPRTRLKPRTTYWARVSYVYRGKPGEHEWTFTTGAK